MMQSAVYIKSEDVVARRIADEIILVPVCGELAAMQRIFSIDTVAEFIWNSLDGKKTITDILNEVTDSFEVETGAAETDLNAFIQSLINAELVTEVSIEM